MSITQPPKPPDIEATTWHAIGAMYILKFLVPLRGAYLYRIYDTLPQYDYLLREPMGAVENGLSESEIGAPSPCESRSEPSKATHEGYV